ncbi:MAG: 4Fe-4S binding protein [Kiritimatiellae bacterium]|nr:4Fe-4S binding protein [Kiritimatiellia bacterium]
MITGKSPCFPSCFSYSLLHEHPSRPVPFPPAVFPHPVRPRTIPLAFRFRGTMVQGKVPRGTVQAPKRQEKRGFIMAAVVDREKCAGCGACEADCPVQAISMDDGKAKVDADTCVSCGACTGNCPCEAITLD